VAVSTQRPHSTAAVAVAATDGDDDDAVTQPQWLRYAYGNSFILWCSFYCFHFIDYARFICLFSAVSPLAFRLPF